MVPFFVYVLLGLIQGVGEWLPISSEGMLTLVGLALGIDFTLSLRIAIWMHLGTLAAVLVYYRTEWKAIFFDLSNKNPQRRFLILTTIGTAITGIPIKILLIDLLDPQLLTVFGYLIIGIALLITSALIQFSRSKGTENGKLLSQLTPKQELAIGMAQGFTIIPGISRSGTTVSALLLAKVDPEESFRGSFLMSVPAVLGGTILDLLDLIQEPSGTDSMNFFGMITGILFAFVSGIVTIHVLLQIARKINFAKFTFLMGSLLIILSLFSL